MAYFGLSTKNDEQKAVVRALANNKPFTFITGPAGTGKTLLAMAVGLDGVIETRDFDRMIYTRMQTQMGEQLGFLPGSIDEKTMPFIMPFMDNLGVLTTDASSLIHNYANPEGGKQKIFFDPLQTMRGRSMVRTFGIFDEAQNNDNSIMHAIATRPLNSKFVFIGNFAQVDSEVLRKPENNGMYRLLNGLYEKNANSYFDHINLQEVHRDPVVSIVEDIFRDHDMDDRFKALEERGNVPAFDLFAGFSDMGHGAITEGKR